jgi:hypothetical protein
VDRRPVRCCTLLVIVKVLNLWVFSNFEKLEVLKLPNFLQILNLEEFQVLKIFKS